MRGEKERGGWEGRERQRGEERRGREEEKGGREGRGKGRKTRMEEQEIEVFLKMLVLLLHITPIILLCQGVSHTCGKLAGSLLLSFEGLGGASLLDRLIPPFALLSFSRPFRFCLFLLLLLVELLALEK